VHTLDLAAFGLLWRISLDTLTNAYQQACEAAVVEVDGEMVGYQISTAGPMGGHLARLAVLPSYQGKGIGSALVHDVLEKFERRGTVRVTVNTQRDNHSSLRMYEKAGFRPTSEIYPVYQYIRMG
jgi:ribosomal protein S18 acetylase RimI-like enzyme